MRTRILIPLAANLTIALTLALAGCGGSSDSLVSFRGSSASISRATLDHWMRTTVSADYRARIGTKAPLGLASEPAKASECVAAAQKIVPHDSRGKSKLSDSLIASKCHELHEAIKEQALGALITSQWTAIEAAQAGIHVSPAQLHAAFERYRNQDLPTEAELQKYLAERNWGVSDMIFEVKQRLFEAGLKPKFEAEVKRAGGTDAAYAKLALAQYRSHVAKTSCKDGYVVSGCKEYREPPEGAPVPNLILEAFAEGLASQKTPTRG